ncbi:MAG: DoxX family protein, partial [Acidobacteria bacterium]|nr:DoxX family protein [Acidobacteriota bacterium]
NMAWLKGHFSKTFLAPMTPMMVVTITILETATGIATAVGLVYFLVTGSSAIIWYASIAGAASLTGLFFGQRVAQDYPGAAVLVPYFILQLMLLYLSKPI